MIAPGLRIAVIGSGPAGLYATGHLLENGGVPVEVDVFDRLPTPFGLVRSGVAPDHPEKKQVIDRLFDVYISHPRVRFFGNVEYGVDVSITDLRAWYDAVIFAVGANSDQAMGIPGESLAGCHSAREFVAWYNGHPDFSKNAFDLSSRRAVIVGNGNVALDVARMLTQPARALEKTDIADHAAIALSQSKIDEVLILGRRSHSYAAFNTPELEELHHLDGVDVHVENLGAETSPSKSNELLGRKLKVLNGFAERPRVNGNRRIVLRFLASPVAVLGDTKVRGVRIANNRMEANAAGDSVAVSTGIEEEVKAGLVLRATGYRGEALTALPFDPVKGLIPNRAGRVLERGAPMRGVYVTGWIKRGPRGVIGTNKKCALETVNYLLADLSASPRPKSAMSGPDIEALLRKRKPDLVTGSFWNRIDRSERHQGVLQGRPRVKYATWSDLLSVAGH